MRKLIPTLLACLLFWPAFSQNPNKGDHRVEIIRSKHLGGDEYIYVTIDSIRQGLSIGLDSKGRKISEACFVNGEFTGPFIIYYPEGTVAGKSYMINGNPEGEAINYHRNGNIESIYNYKNGLRDSVCIEYVEDGRLDKRYLFRNDTLIKILENNHLLPLPPGWGHLDTK